jgi:hypothetical protein
MDKVESKPQVSKVADCMVTIVNPSPSWKYGQVIKINDTLALVVSLLEKEAHAIAFHSLSNTQNLEISEDSLDTTVDFNGHQIDVANILKLSKAPYKREKIFKQLVSGHLRVDLAQPMAEGNFILFKGDKVASGKQQVACDTMCQYLKIPSNKVVYVGYSQQVVSMLKKNAGGSKNLSVICVPEHNEAMAYFAPM